MNQLSNDLDTKRLVSQVKHDCYGEFTSVSRCDTPVTPHITVVMSVYNGELHIAEAVQSILDQSWPDLELLIADDGSTDDTYLLLKDIATRDARVIIVQQPNLGLTRTLNRLFTLARGRYIARQDADDISLPARLERQVAFLQSHSSLAAVGTQTIRFTDRLKLGPPSAIVNTPERIRRALLSRNCLVHGSIMLNASVLGTVRYDDAFDCAQDYELWHRLSAHFDMDNIPEPLYLYRDNGQNISRRRAVRQAFLACLVAKRNELGSNWRLYINDESAFLQQPTLAKALLRLLLLMDRGDLLMEVWPPRSWQHRLGQIEVRWGILSRARAVLRTIYRLLNRVGHEN